LKENKADPTPNRTVYKIPLITEKDAKEYENVKAGLIT